MAYSTRARTRVGYSDARELGWLALTHKVANPKFTHTVDKALALLEHMGIETLRTPEASRLYSSPADRAWLEAQPFADRPFIVLAPTSAWPAKEWPSERFRELAQRLATAARPVVLVGARKERERLAPLLQLCAASPVVIDRVGHTSVGQLMAIIERAALVVCNDSACAHLAVGFDRALVAIFGPTDLRLAAPFGRAQDVLQRVEPGDEFYFRDGRSAGMIRRISVDEVYTACATRLAMPIVPA
jgi:ADP-heptose:LPS heptosyltransferase